MNLQLLKQCKLIHLCFIVTFVSSGLLINSVQLILFLTLHKINKRLYRKINYYLGWLMYSLIVGLATWWANFKLILYIDKNDYETLGKEHALCISNHQNDLDFLFGWIIAEPNRRLGNCKGFAKKVVQYIPILGWCWKFSELVFLERSIEKDRIHIKKQVAELTDHPDPMWLLFFPEGTRFTTEKHKISQEFAKERNYKQLKHHLQPRTRGFITSIPSLRGKSVILDLVTGFDKNSDELTLGNLLKGKAMTAHVYIKRITLDKVPDTEAKQDIYLRKLFENKDNLKDSFLKTGDYFATSGVERCPAFNMGPRIHTLINLIFWCCAVVFTILGYLIKWLINGQILYFSIGTLILVIFYALINKIGQPSGKSSYGVNSNDKKKAN